MAGTSRDAMTPNPRTIEPGTSITDAARLMRDEDVGSLPIVEGDRLAGMLTDRDIVIRAVADGTLDRTAGDIASRELTTIDPQQSLEEAARLMAEHQVQRLPVCEEDGRLVGILSLQDVSLHLDEARTGDVVEGIKR
jgi:CBS domain-containing protein